MLLVEDNEDDILLIRRGFERAGVGTPLQTVRSGPAALAYLSGSQPYFDRTKHPLPALVLLDINMPGADGFAVLRWIRRQPQFASLCVAILSSSDDMRDVNLAHHLGANLFLVKPLDFVIAAELWRALQRLLAEGQASAFGNRQAPLPA